MILPAGTTGAAPGSIVTTPRWLGSPSGVSVVRPLLWWLYNLLLFPRSSRAIVSCTHHAVPFRRRQIVTVHDIRPYYYPDSWVQKINFRVLLPRSLRRCDAILTVSQASKALLEEIYKLEPERIHVVPNAIDTEYFSPASEELRQGEAPFLLAVGGNWRHKNISEVLRMHRHWADRYVLKVICSNATQLASLRSQSRELSIERQVCLLSKLSRDELRRSYRACSAVVYPSLMEGFGIPPLEAMACGRPAIVSDSPLFRDLYQDVPIYVRLGDPSSWSRAFDELEGISAQRITAGIAVAKNFNLERMRQALFEALSSVWGEAWASP